MSGKSIAVLMAVLLSLALAGVLWAQETKKGRENIVLPLTEAKAVHLEHWEHQEKAAPCDNCHKFFPQEQGAVARLKGSGALERGKVMGNCRACHKERNAASGECKTCHRG